MLMQYEQGNRVKQNTHKYYSREHLNHGNSKKNEFLKISINKTGKLQMAQEDNTKARKSY